MSVSYARPEAEKAEDKRLFTTRKYSQYLQSVKTGMSDGGSKVFSSIRAAIMPESNLGDSLESNELNDT